MISYNQIQIGMKNCTSNKITSIVQDLFLNNPKAFVPLLITNNSKERAKSYKKSENEANKENLDPHVNTVLVIQNKDPNSTHPWKQTDRRPLKDISKYFITKPKETNVI